MTVTLAVPLATLATLLDLPTAVSVASVGYHSDLVDTTRPGDVDATFAPGAMSIVLHLDGTGLAGPAIDAEYSVDGTGHRSFGRFKPLAGATSPAPTFDAAGDPIAPAELPATPRTRPKTGSTP